jgi:hypothetical protein
MKRYIDLTNEEILALDEQGIENLIDLECAIDSVPLLPVRPVEPVKPAHEKDQKYYTLGDFKFVNQHEALNVEELLKSYNLVSTEGYGETKRVVPLTEYYQPQTKTEKAYSKEKYEEIEKELKKYTESNNNYAKDLAEYNRIKTLREELERNVYNKIEDVTKTYGRENELRGQFARYVQLADGDATMALRFLNNANSDAVDYPAIQKLGGK